MEASNIDFNAFDQPFSSNVAKQLDEQFKDDAAYLRHEFIVPQKADLSSATAHGEDRENQNAEESVYLCGNSLGLQPKKTAQYVQRYLETWASKGVNGHFKDVEDGFTKPWVDIDDEAKSAMAGIVGAQVNEVAVMQTLTANLHFLMLSFYKPTSLRYKIIIEGKAFPSDHFAVQSQLAHHGLFARDALVILEPSDEKRHYYSTASILNTIYDHADSTALILLPGVQYYTGQLFDIPTITEYAHRFDITVGWDLAHAAGNVPLQLHTWNVDFAVWCTYKYLNAGPGAIGALFVHAVHGRVQSPGSVAVAARDVVSGGLEAEHRDGFRHRLVGWWGSDRRSRFQMDNVFVPMAGASGWQLSNPSVLDTTSVLASLAVFAQTDMLALRKRSIRLTAYLEFLLLRWPCLGGRPYALITPASSNERGAQISVMLEPGKLEAVIESLTKAGVVVDERKPDVIRISPAPLYNNFQDVWKCVKSLRAALEL